MNLTPLEIDGAWLAESPVWPDDRGFLREWYKAETVGNILGKKFGIEQANISVSSRGTLRGIHYSLNPDGQAKWVTCVSGSIVDVVVDIRPSSKTFGKWIEVELDGKSGRAVYIGEGLGHGFVSLSDNSAVAYLLNSPFSPSEEYAINPLDPALAVNWRMNTSELIISEKDRNAPTLEGRKTSGKLPK